MEMEKLVVEYEPSINKWRVMEWQVEKPGFFRAGRWLVTCDTEEEANQFLKDWLSDEAECLIPIEGGPR
jgi:hypothetical protein